MLQKQHFVIPSHAYLAANQQSCNLHIPETLVPIVDSGHRQEYGATTHMQCVYMCSMIQMSIYTYIYMYVSWYIYIHIHVYIERDGDRERCMFIRL